MSQKPIPLSAPDGTVYAYACPRCRKVGMICSYGQPYDDDAVARVAEHSREDVERCCRCAVCGADTSPGRWPRECDACKPAQDEKRAASELRWAAKAARDAEAQEAAIALALDRDAAVRLRDCMSDISEDRYCAGWLSDLEFTLWGAVVDGEPFQFGMGRVESSDIAELRRLSEKCGGWWRFDDEHGEVFVPIDEWRGRYEAERGAT